MNESRRVLVELQNQAAKARDSLILESKSSIQRELDAARSKAAIAILEDALKNRHPRPQARR